MIYKSKEARNYQALMRERLIYQGWQVSECVEAGWAVRVYMVWYRGRKAGDLDKRIGVILDAMQGLLYDDDSQVKELHAKSEDDQFGRLEIVVEPTGAPCRKFKANVKNSKRVGAGQKMLPSSDATGRSARATPTPTLRTASSAQSSSSERKARLARR